MILNYLTGDINNLMDSFGVGYQHIKSIKFGVWSAEDIKRHSVLKVTSRTLYGPGSVSDPKLGRLEPGEECPTCGLDSKKCPSHLGHIELNAKIKHPLYITTIVHILKTFCWHCSSALISRERYELLGLLNKKQKTKIKNVTEITSKIYECPECGGEQPLFNENKTDKIITMYPTKTKTKISQKNKGVELSGEDISERFDNIAEEDVVLLGLDTHPRNLIITNLPVLHARARPYVIQQGKTSEDDITHKYPEIVKVNNRIEQAATDEERKKSIADLEFHIRTLFDNTHGKAKLTKDRPMKSLKQRLNGKGGLFRGNLMGKRVDECFRTVIGPDPTLRMDEVAVPPQICKNLRFPERVFEGNLEKLKEMVYDGKVSSIVKSNGVKFDAKVISWTMGTRLKYGDKVRRGGVDITPESTLKFELREGDVILRKESGYEEIPVVLPERKDFKLEIGDRVYRELMEGDEVLVNRQPSRA